MSATSFPFWIDLDGLLRRWNTNLDINVFEAIRAGLQVYEEPRDVDLIGMINLSPDEVADRFYRGGQPGVKPLDHARIRFNLQELLEFERSHYDPWQSAAWAEKPLNQKEIAKRAGVTDRQVRTWQKRQDFPKKHTVSEIDAWLDKTGLGKRSKQP
ncbi:MAG: hypothetical protein AB7U63_16240 [Porticoccaceae bacterium]